MIENTNNPPSPLAGGQKRKVNISVPDIYKQTDEAVWLDLEQYLYTGFLTNPAVIQEKSFVFKTINSYELRNIQFLRPSGGGLADGSAMFRNAFIAYSLLMVDGNNTLYERPRHISRLIKAISKLAVKIQDNIVENLTALNERASLLLPLVEVYAYENRSRYRWLQIKGNPIHSTISTGIPGTSDIGMNVCQQTWVAINHVIDRNEEIERDWQNAKFIGSCFAGKGMRSIEEKDKSRRQRDKEDREDLKMKVLYTYLNRRIGKDIPGEEPVPIKLPDGRMAQVVKRFRADSAEELADQLSAALSGEQDYHDTVIEAKVAQLRKRGEEQETFRKSLAARAPLVSGQGNMSSGARILGGKAEADAYVARMKALQLEQVQRAARERKPEPENSDDQQK
jgi:hypothetical protein